MLLGAYMPCNKNLTRIRRHRNKGKDTSYYIIRTFDVVHRRTCKFKLAQSLRSLGTNWPGVWAVSEITGIPLDEKMFQVLIE